MEPTRRHVLKAMGAFALAAGGAPLYSEAFGNVAGIASPAPAEAPVALKDIAAQKGIVYGSAVSWMRVQQDPEYANLIVRQDKIVTAETELKWKALLPRPDKFNFDTADALVHWAQS